MIKLKECFKEGVESWELSMHQEKPSIVADKENPIWVQVIEAINEELEEKIKVVQAENVHTQIRTIEEEAEFAVDEASFHALFVLEGSSHILSSRKKMTLNKGDSIFLQAGYGTYCIVGTCKVMFITIA